MNDNPYKLPNKLFIFVENPGTDDEFLSTHEELATIIVETGQRQLVGEYVLHRKVEVVTETTVVTEIG